MVNHPLYENAADIPGMPGSNFQNDLISYGAFVLPVGQDLGDYTFNTGSFPSIVIDAQTGVTFKYEDSTLEDDGIDVLVSGDGRRYFSSENSAAQFGSVLDVLDEPPADPDLYDAWIVGSAPTGEWADYANHIARKTRREWDFYAPFVGSSLLNISTGKYLHLTDNGAWLPPSFDIVDGAIRLEKLADPFGMSVEAIQNDPPGSPAVQVYYVVGDIPTGAWIGQAKKVTYWDGSAWQFRTPYQGAQVYDKTQKSSLTYEDGDWAGVSENVLANVIARIDVDHTTNLIGSALSVDLGEFTYQGDTTKFLKISFLRRSQNTSRSFLTRACSSFNNAGDVVKLGLKRDNEANFVEVFAHVLNPGQPASGFNQVTVGLDHRISSAVSAGALASVPAIAASSGAGEIYGETSFGFHQVLDEEPHLYKIRLEWSALLALEYTGARIDGTFIIEEWGE